MEAYAAPLAAIQLIAPRPPLAAFLRTSCSIVPPQRPTNHPQAEPICTQTRGPFNHVLASFHNPLCAVAGAHQASRKGADSSVVRYSTMRAHTDRQRSQPAELVPQVLLAGPDGHPPSQQSRTAADTTRVLSIGSRRRPAGGSGARVASVDGASSGAGLVLNLEQGSEAHQQQQSKDGKRLDSGVGSGRIGKRSRNGNGKAETGVGAHRASTPNAKPRTGRQRHVSAPTPRPDENAPGDEHPAAEGRRRSGGSTIALTATDPDGDSGGRDSSRSSNSSRSGGGAVGGGRGVGSDADGASVTDQVARGSTGAGDAAKRTQQRVAGSDSALETSIWVDRGYGDSNRGGAAEVPKRSDGADNMKRTNLNKWRRLLNGARLDGSSGGVDIPSSGIKGSVEGRGGHAGRGSNTLSGGEQGGSRGSSTSSSNINHDSSSSGSSGGTRNGSPNGSINGSKSESSSKGSSSNLRDRSAEGGRGDAPGPLPAQAHQEGNPGSLSQPPRSPSAPVDGGGNSSGKGGQGHRKQGSPHGVASVKHRTGFSTRGRNGSSTSSSNGRRSGGGHGSSSGDGGSGGDASTGLGGRRHQGAAVTRPRKPVHLTASRQLPQQRRESQQQQHRPRVAAAQANPWRVTCIPIDMAALYPDLASFASAVRSEARSWHPLRISAALNHAAKMWDQLDSKRRSPGGADRLRGDEEILHRTLDTLYDAFLPYINSVLHSRYVINTLWACAKVGYWGRPGSGLVAALLSRLRHNRYELLQLANGQTHGNLWWALSQYDQLYGTEASSGRVEAAPTACPLPGVAAPAPRSAPSKEHGPGHERPQQVYMQGKGEGTKQVPGKGQVPEHEVAQLQPRVAGGLAATPEPSSTSSEAKAMGNPAGPPGQAAQVAGGMDILKASAAIIKSRKVLDAENFKPQECSIIILAAARLGYSDDPELILHLLHFLIKHPGPFKPQSVSNTIYGLGELYGRESTFARVNGAGESESEGEGEGRSRRLPVALVPGILGLVELAQRQGLQNYSPQELSNMGYGLARLGLQLRQEFGSDAAEAAEAPAAWGHRTPDGQGGTDLQQQQDKEEEEEGRKENAVTESAKGDPVDNYHHQQQQQQQRKEQQDKGEQQQGAVAAFSKDPQEVEGEVEAAEDMIRRFVVQLAEHARERLQALCGIPQSSSLREGAGLPRTTSLRGGPNGFGPQAVCVVTWSMAIMGYGDVSYYTTVVRAVLHGNCMAGATVQELGMFLWALATVRYRPPGELLGLLHSTLLHVNDANTSGHAATTGHAAAVSSSAVPMQCPTLLWSLAVNGLYDEDVVRQIVARLGPSDLAARDFAVAASCLWSLAVMPEGALARLPEAVGALVGAVNGWEATQEVGTIPLVQLWQFHLELEAAVNNPIASARVDTTPVAAGAEAAMGCAALQPRRTGRVRQRSVESRMPDAGDEPAVKGSATASGQPAAAAAPAPAPAALPRLKPALVAFCQQAIVQCNSAIKTGKTTSLQSSVYRHLCFLMASQALQRHQLQSQQMGRRRRLLGQARGRGTGASPHAGSDGEGDTVGTSASRDGDASDEEAAAAPTMTKPSKKGGRLGVRPTAARRLPAMVSDRARALAETVRIMRVEPEWPMEPVGALVDVCMWLSDGRRVVVEVDGPCHFFINEPRTPMPSTLLRDRQLGRVLGQANFKVVPHWEWRVLTTSEAKTAYLTRLLGLGSQG